MAGKADVHPHLASRRSAITEFFGAWHDAEASAPERAQMVQQYFHDANVGSTKLVGAGTSVLVKARRSDPTRPNVLVLGRHGVHDLAHNTESPPAASSEHFVGPGLATRLGATVAFCEGVQAAASVTVDEPLNLTYLSVGDGDTFASALSHVFTGNLDAVFITSATMWHSSYPTLTAGCRGRVLAELTLTSGSNVDDFTVSGGVRNPLTTMTQLVGSLRDDRGRIALNGFYDRAQRPDASRRAALHPDGFDADMWATTLGLARPGGSLTSLERASLWPGVSVLAIETSSQHTLAAPGTVRATIAIYLVPDQRPAEIERSLRSWFDQFAPADLQPTLRIVDTTRPFRVDDNSAPVSAQRRAAFRLFGTQPVLVPAGAEAGSGELAYALGAPVAFAGIATPTASAGSWTEELGWQQVVAGAAMAAETAVQMRRL